MLRPKQEQFCLEYIKDLNATQAAIRAGYSAKTADRIGPELLGKPCVAEKIDALKKARSERTEITADTILKELLRLATVDVSKAFDSTGGLLPLHEIPEDVRRAIAGVEVAEMFDGSGDQKHAIGLIKKLKFWDKNKALEALGKHLKLFTEKHEHSLSKDTLEALVSGGNKE